MTERLKVLATHQAENFSSVGKKRQHLITLWICLIGFIVVSTLTTCSTSATQHVNPPNHYVSTMNLKGNGDKGYLWLMLHFNPKAINYDTPTKEALSPAPLHASYNIGIGEPAKEALFAKYKNMTLKFIMNW